jgi:hypothetical protein
MQQAGDPKRKLIRPHQRHRRPGGHHRATMPCPRPVGAFAARVAAMPTPSNHLASLGTGILRRAESSITIELA